MGDILVFLTGQDDIDTAVHLLNEEAQSNGKKSSGSNDKAIMSGLVVVCMYTSQISCYLLKCTHTRTYALCIICICLCLYAFMLPCMCVSVCCDVFDVPWSVDGLYVVNKILFCGIIS